MPSGQVTAAGPGAVIGADPAAEAVEADGEGCGEYGTRRGIRPQHWCTMTPVRVAPRCWLRSVLEALLAAVFLDSGCDMVVPAALSKHFIRVCGRCCGHGNGRCSVRKLF